MSTIIAVASGKGGVGKTLITAALSVALYRRGHTVLAVDADMGLRNLDLMFGMQDGVLYDAGDVVKGRCRIEDALLSIAPGLDFFAASQKHTWEKVDAPTYHYFVETLSKKYEYTLIDCPPGRGQAYKAAAAMADRIFFVVEPTWSSMRDAARVMQYCNKHKRFNYDVLFNNFYGGNSAYVSVQEMMQVLNPERIAGILPHDQAVHQAAQNGAVVHAESPFMTALEETAAYIESAVSVDIDRLTALLPACEGGGENISRDEPHDADEAVLGPMKALAAAELQKAAAMLEKPESALDEKNRNQPSVQASPDKAGLRGLSMKKRRAQSMAWRHYRR